MTINTHSITIYLATIGGPLFFVFRPIQTTWLGNTESVIDICEWIILWDIQFCDSFRRWILDANTWTSFTTVTKTWPPYPNIIGNIAGFWKQQTDVKETWLWRYYWDRTFFKRTGCWFVFLIIWKISACWREQYSKVVIRVFDRRSWSKFNKQFNNCTFREHSHSNSDGDIC